jgi:16S rRNA (guanine966-N2)-methyltransferase
LRILRAVVGFSKAPRRARREEQVMRVTGGRLAGRRLRAPREGVRPTADRVREALFARIDPEGAAVLDLYAGSGALGIEALSRGAASVVFVERARRCAAVLRENLAALELAERAEVVASEAVAAVARLSGEGRRFDLVLLDPPYASDEAARALAALARSELLPEQAMVVLESSRRRPAPVVEGWLRLDERRYGETLITRFRRAPATAGRRSTRG